MHYIDNDTSNKKIYNLLSSNLLNVEREKTVTVNSNYITAKDSTENNKTQYPDMKLIYT